jgi:hypothetical protein
MKAEPAPRLGLLLLVWLVLIGLMAFACAPVIYVLAVTLSAAPW